jgi:hypothetical protein
MVSFSDKEKLYAAIAIAEIAARKKEREYPSASANRWEQMRDEARLELKICKDAREVVKGL